MADSDRQEQSGGAPDQQWTLYMDGASCKEGSGAGLILTSPTGEEVTYALHFDFHTSKNEAEYEALLAGLRLAVKMGSERVVALTEWRLPANQQISRGNNRRADALSKLTLTCFGHLSKEVLVEVLKARSIDERQVDSLSVAQPNWMTPIIDYLQHDILPDDHREARKTRVRAPQYAMLKGTLYRKGYTAPWLKCIDDTAGKLALKEAHAGSARAHDGARALTGKVLRMGLYWPEIHQDAIELTRICVECQTFTPTQEAPPSKMTSILSP
uniref:RNase H type-1 domain-containing protein n=1 Tax=Lactuca sativa TaxID=4236 RepID=A0A9R1UI12_LACSA|nr:hypothetical protein LSAT_V11C900487230 [Lactuca sativa]